MHCISTSCGEHVHGIEHALAVAFACLRPLFAGGRVSFCQRNAERMRNTMRLERSMATRWALLALFAVAIGFTPALAQGTLTGVLTGVVESTDGSRLPGVTVTVT